LAKPAEYFENAPHLAGRDDIFKLTVLKDAHQRPEYHRGSAYEMGCHGWIIYYHPKIVQHLAPYVRPEHCLRTYHTIDPARVPLYNPETHIRCCLLSGAINLPIYPMRACVVKYASIGKLPNVDLLPHPGYHNNGTNTNDYLETLKYYKVAICTSSVYGYSLRKLIEATACGCRVITDLPVDDPLPEIDGNLHRIDLRPINTFAQRMGELVTRLSDSYSPEEQRHYASRAIGYYDFRVMGKRLATQIEELRNSYAAEHCLVQ
jgi:hypothetical protein